MKELGLFFIFSILISCSPTQENSTPSSKVDSLAIEYNNKGFKLAQFSASQDTLELALAHFDKALKIDSTYQRALGNKVGVLLRLNRFDQALKTHTELYEIDPGESAMLQGMLVEKTADFEKAEPYYIESVRYFSTRFDTTASKEVQLGFGINKVYSLYLAKRNERAEQFYDSLLAEFSDNQVSRFHPQLGKQEFNRLKFMEDFFSQ